MVQGFTVDYIIYVQCTCTGNASQANFHGSLTIRETMCFENLVPYWYIYTLTAPVNVCTRLESSLLTRLCVHQFMSLSRATSINTAD